MVLGEMSMKGQGRGSTFFHGGGGGGLRYSRPKHNRGGGVLLGDLSPLDFGHGCDVELHFLCLQLAEWSSTPGSITLAKPSRIYGHKVY